MRAWSQAYRDDGLIVVGVHTPEFSFEHQVDGVRKAIEERGIDYPVAVDNDYAIWTAFDNHYWPRAVLRRPRRRHPPPSLRRRALRGVRARDPGVARSRARARVRRRRRRGGGGRLGTPADARDVSRLRPRERVRVGERRRVRRTASYELPDRLPSNGGPSPASGRSGARRSCSSGRTGASPAGSTRATRTSCCSTERREPIPFRLLLDGEAPGAAHGVDVDEAGNGVLAEGRLYQLVRRAGSRGEGARSRSPSGSPASRRTLHVRLERRSSAPHHLARLPRAPRMTRRATECRRAST